MAGVRQSRPGPDSVRIILIQYMTDLDLDQLFQRGGNLPQTNI